jgi:hypothetical protein
MPTATAGQIGLQATSGDNWILDSQSSGVFAKVISISWGGQATTSTGARTRWARPTTAATSTFTALAYGYHQPNYATFGSRVGTFATAAVYSTPDPGANLYAVSWNTQGGVGILIHPLANPWWVVNGVLQGQIGCKQVTTTDSTSSLEVTVEE